jgi:hypothetical protein
MDGGSCLPVYAHRISDLHLNDATWSLLDDQAIRRRHGWSVGIARDPNDWSRNALQTVQSCLIVLLVYQVSFSATTRLVFGSTLQEAALTFLFNFLSTPAIFIIISYLYLRGFKSKGSLGLNGKLEKSWWVTYGPLPPGLDNLKTEWELMNDAAHSESPVGNGRLRLDARRQLRVSGARHHRIRLHGLEWFGDADGHVVSLESPLPRRRKWRFLCGELFLVNGFRSSYSTFGVPNWFGIPIRFSEFPLGLSNLARGVSTGFTNDPGPDLNPVWSPDGMGESIGPSQTRFWRGTGETACG